jgi:serine protease Do
VSVGIGFAVPAAIARRVVDQLVKYGETRRGWLGVRIQDVTEEIAESLGLDMARGALVAGVAEGGPADEAGLVAGDVITRFDGQNVAEMRDLPRIVADTEPGRGVEVEIVRDGEVMSLEVTVRQLEEEAADRPKGDKDQAKPPSDTVLGLKLAPLDDDMRDVYGIEADIEGVVVIEVDPDSAAADKGIAEGTVIVEVAQNEVRDPIDVINRVEDLKSQGRRSVLLLLSNGTGELRFVAIRVEDEE